MAFQLRREESVADGLRRLAKKELRSARDTLRRTSPSRDEAVHEARKSVKKVRAILQLVKTDDGSGLAKSQNQLRVVNRALSRLRDTDVILETLAKLRARNPQLFSEHTFARLRRRLAAEKRRAYDTAQRKGLWKKVDRELRNLRRAAKRWHSAHRRFGALAPGIRRTFRRGRTAMTRALTRQTAADFHEWRKQLKALWYELRLIDACSRTVHRDVAALHRAETLLGDDHNVVVLCAELSKDASVCDGAVDRKALRLAADRYECDLRERAVATVQRIYERTPRDYVRTVKRAWKSWQRTRTVRRPKRSRRAAA